MLIETSGRKGGIQATKWFILVLRHKKAFNNDKNTLLKACFE